MKQPVVFVKLRHKTNMFLNNNKYNLIMLKKILVNSFIFILFSFLNVTLPIVVCLLASTMQYGAYATMGIGYVTTFLLAFSQVGFSFAIFSSFFYFQNANKKNLDLKLDVVKKDLIYDVLFLGIVYGIILTLLYFGSSYTYTRFANIHKNTVDSLPYAYQFIYSSCGFVLLVTIQYSLIMIINNKRNQIHAFLQLFIAFFITILMICIFTFFTNLKGYGLGIGLTIGSLISIITSFFHLFLFTDTFKSNRFYISGKYLLLVLKNTWRQTAITVSIQIFKGCALLLLSYQIPNALKNSVPLDYQMARIVWYNMMYLVPFIFNGLTDSLYYYFIKDKSYYESHKDKIDLNLLMMLILLSSLILTILLIVACNYLVTGLSTVYIKNQDHSYTNESIASDLNGIGKAKLIDYINSADFLNDQQKHDLVQFISTASEEQINKIITDTILPKFTTFDLASLQKMLIFPNSFTYFYLCFYCVLYGAGQLLNAFGLSVTNNKPKVLLLVTVQLLAILFVVEFGVKYQETQKFYLMEAWSFPLLIIGIVAFVYMSFNYFLMTSKYIKQYYKSNNN